MLEQLRFVQGAIAKKDFVPALTHLAIEHGRVKSYNGRVALSCPIDLDFDVRPKAIPFIKAVATCREEIALHMTTSGRLAVRSGKFRALIDCDSGPYPEVFPDGKMIEAPSNMLQAMKRLAPFISEDASRVWSRGIMFDGDMAYATNNIVALRYPLAEAFPIPCNLPEAGVNEVLRIGETPKYLLMAENHLTFFYEGDRWLRVQLCHEPAPDLGGLIDRMLHDGAPVFEQIDSSFAQGLDDIAPHTGIEGAVYLREGRAHTSPDDEQGASVAIAHTAVAAFSHTHLRDLLNIAHEIDFSTYPKPCAFQGIDGVQGVVIGRRL